jgi:hypothetical protein
MEEISRPMPENPRLLRALTVALALVVGAVAVVLVGVYYSCSHFLTERHLNARMESVTDELARVLVFPLWNGNQDVIQGISEAFLKSEDLIGIRVVTEYGDVLYDHLPEGGDRRLVRDAMIRQGDHYFGQVRLQFTRQPLARRQRLTLLAVLITGLPVIGVIIVGARFALKRILDENREGST